MLGKEAINNVFALVLSHWPVESATRTNHRHTRMHAVQRAPTHRADTYTISSTE